MIGAVGRADNNVLRRGLKVAPAGVLMAGSRETAATADPERLWWRWWWWSRSRESGSFGAKAIN